MELLKVDTIEEALRKLTAYGNLLPDEYEEVDHFKTAGRILAEDVVCLENVPGFDRSTVDGYAVRSADTGGASESLPTFLEIVGEVEMGKEAVCQVGPGCCAYVPTGGMMPPGADSMVMVEYCEAFGSRQLAVYASAAPANNVVKAGDDVAAGQIVFSRGRRLSYADVGVLSAIGKTKVKVFKPWKAAIFSTGDEIISPDAAPGPGQVRDVNTFTLLALAEEMGLQVTDYAVICDDYETLKARAAAAMNTADLIFISGGSSKGKKDVTAKIIDDLSSTGVITHGIAIKPGKPTITGFDEATATALIGLPGHPVAAALLFRLLTAGLTANVQPAGSDSPAEELLASGITIYGRMAINIGASPGRKTFQLVKLKPCPGEEFPKVMPILGASGLIRTLSDADGFIVMDVNHEGLNKGELTKVYLL